MHTRKTVLARNSLLNLAGQVLPILVGVVTLPYIIRGLGTDRFGVLSIGWMMLGYFGIFDLGMGRATTRFVCESLRPGQIEELPGLFWTSLRFQLVSGIAGALVFCLFALFAAQHILKIPPELQDDTRTTLLILGGCIPILLASNAARGVLEASQRFDLVNYVRVPASISFYLLAAACIPFGISVSGIVFLSALSRVATAVGYFLLCFRLYPALRRQASFSRTVFRRLASFGGWVMVSNITEPVLSYLERFFIVSLLPVGLFSYYAAPVQVVSKIVIFAGSLAPTLFPFFSYHGTKNAAVVSDVSARSCKYLLFLMTPIVTVLFLFSKEILLIWLGPDFAAKSSLVLQLLVLGYFLNSFGYIPFTSVQALDRPDLKAKLDMVMVPVYAGLLWMMIGRMGIDGAALAKLVVTLVDVVALFWFAQRLGAFSLRIDFPGKLSRGLTLSVVLTVLAFLVRSLHLSLPVGLSLLVVLFAAYTVAFWMMATEENEKELVRSFSRHVLARRKAI